MSGRSPSLWLDPPPAPGPGLDSDIEVDLAVVGAGYTGLWAALAAREQGASVAVLERDYAGFGASGRNAGHLTSTIGKDLPTLLRLYGRERAGALVRLAEEGIEHVEAAIADRGIECEYVPSGNVIAAVNSAQARRLERAARAGEEVGAAVEWQDGPALRERGVARAFVAGVLEPKGGVLDPGLYVRGLRERVVEAGAHLYEGTRVESIEGGSPVRIETPRGTVTADRAVLATNAYTPELGLLPRTLVRISVSLFATSPLTDEQLERIGWTGREGVYTAHEILESYRLTAGRRIVGGSRFIRYGFGSRPLPDADDAISGKLESMFRRRFPELRDVAVERCWSGPIGFTADFLPAVGRRGPVVHGVGYAGHGVALASLTGVRLAGMALRGEEPPAALPRRFRPPLPPEPLRYALARGIIGALERIDRRADERAEVERS